MRSKFTVASERTNRRNRRRPGCMAMVFVGLKLKNKVGWFTFLAIQFPGKQVSEIPPFWEMTSREPNYREMASQETNEFWPHFTATTYAGAKFMNHWVLNTKKILPISPFSTSNGFRIFQPGPEKRRVKVGTQTFGHPVVGFELFSQPGTNVLHNPVHVHIFKRANGLLL